jgi:hypothetical protein
MARNDSGERFKVVLASALTIAGLMVSVPTRAETTTSKKLQFVALGVGCVATSPIQMAECVQDDRSQKFYIKPSSYHYRGLEMDIHIEGDGNCLDVAGSKVPSPSSPTRVQSWWCNSTDAQRWIFEGVALRSNMTDTADDGFSGWCLDVPGSNFTAGAKLQLWQCNKSGAQRWNFTQGGRIQSYARPEFCVTASSNDEGAPVTLQRCGAPNQIWYPSQNGFTTPTDKSIGVDDSTPGFGLQVTTRTYAGRKGQSWSLAGQIKSALPVGTSPYGYCLTLANNYVVELRACSSYSTAFANYQEFRFQSPDGSTPLFTPL